MNEALKQLFEELRHDYAELRRTVEQRAAEAARGAVDPLLEQQIARINEAIAAKEQARDTMLSELHARVNRLELAAPAGRSEAAQEALAQFNRELRSAAAVSGRAVPEIEMAGYDAYRSAFRTYLRRGRDGLAPEEIRAMSVGSDPDGGYTVIPEISTRIMRRVFELSPVRQYATVESIGSDALEGEHEIDEAAAGWVGETGARAETGTPTLGRYRIVVHEMYAQPKSSQKLLEDSNRDIQAWLVRRTSEKFAALEGKAFVAGTGVTQPRGFTTYPTNTTGDSSRSWGTFEHVATGTSGGFGSDPNGVKKLLDVIHKLNPVYLANAAWYLNRNTLATVRQLTDASTQGKFVFIPSFSATVPDTLLGYPVRVLVDMPDLAAGSLSVAFGDLAAAYTVVDRVGLSLLVDPYTDKPHVRFYMRRRVGGDVVNFDALKFLKFS